jgi:NAD-dependent SIR2 family protein deacetylase
MPRFTSTLSSIDEIPRCGRCQQILRPNVLMFSDPSMVWTNIDLGEDRFRRWMEPKMNVLGIEIGAGTVIPSIRYIAEERTSTLIRINPYESEVNRRHDVSMSYTALEGINMLVSLL